MNAPATITADTADRDLQWAYYLDLLSNRDKIVQAAGYGHTWYDDFDDDQLDEIEARLEGRMASCVCDTATRAMCVAAITVIDVVRDERRMAADIADVGRRVPEGEAA